MEKRKINNKLLKRTSENKKAQKPAECTHVNNDSDRIGSNKHVVIAFRTIQ